MAWFLTLVIMVLALVPAMIYTLSGGPHFESPSTIFANRISVSISAFLISWIVQALWNATRKKAMDARNIHTRINWTAAILLVVDWIL